MDFFYLPPFKPHCFTLTVCESAYATLLGIHEIISFVPAPFPPFQVTLRDLKSITGHFQHLAATNLPAVCEFAYPSNFYR